MRKPGRWIIAALFLVGVVWMIAGRRETRPSQTSRATARVTAPVERVVEGSVRIRVEVLNGTGIRGMARRATAAMRDAGFDVVSSGNADERADSSLVLVRSGRMDWGALAVKALGGARVEARPDSSRYIDLTIIVGTRWRPPPEPLDP